MTFFSWIESSFFLNWCALTASVHHNFSILLFPMIFSEDPLQELFLFSSNLCAVNSFLSWNDQINDPCDRAPFVEEDAVDLNHGELCLLHFQSWVLAYATRHELQTVYDPFIVWCSVSTSLDTRHHQLAMQGNRRFPDTFKYVSCKADESRFDFLLRGHIVTDLSVLIVFCLRTFFACNALTLHIRIWWGNTKSYVCKYFQWNDVDRSEIFPRTRLTKKSCTYDCGMRPVSVDAFFFLLSSLFFSYRIVP